MQSERTDAETRGRGDAGRERRSRFFVLPLRIPLSAKILGWFFLNLTVLTVVFVLLFNAQFQFDLDWVFSGSARQRVDAMRTLIVGELNAAAPDDWGTVLYRFSDVYDLHFSLFESDGKHLIGSITELPEEVRQRMAATPTPPKPGVSAPVQAAPGATPQAASRSRNAGASRAFLRAGDPPRYWLLLRTRLDNPQAGGPMRVILVARADSLSMGGLILDPAPWLGLAMVRRLAEGVADK